MTQAFEAIILEPKIPADSCIIWLHGLGANGYDFVDAVESLDLPKEHGIRFIFPHAPSQPVTINANLVMPAWFDIIGLDIDSAQDKNGIEKSSTVLKNLIYKLIDEGIPSQRIILTGFSQGGALALHTGVRFDKPLGGIASLSSYLPLHDFVAKESAHLNKEIPIFMGHGFMDPVVSYWIGQKSYSYLQGAGFNPKWHAYPIAHTVCLPELNDLGKWIKEILKI